MTNSKLLLGLLLVSVACSHPGPPAVNGDTVAIEQALPDPKADDNGADLNLMKRIDSAVNAIRRGSYATKMAYFPPDSTHDALKTTLFFKDGKALRIQYAIFEEGRAAVGNEDIYFDKSLAVIKERRYTNATVYQCVTFNGRYLEFTKSTIDGALKKEDIFEPDGSIGFVLKIAHDFKQQYPDIKFDIPEVWLKGEAALEILTAIPLFESPDTNARKIKLLEPSTVGFKSSNDIVGNYRNKKWIWYFVRSYTDSGWIVGHPDFVRESNETSGDEGEED